LIKIFFSYYLLFGVFPVLISEVNLEKLFIKLMIGKSILNHYLKKSS
tara:strand:- start:210 stop:350 length:141 start_codon:yes stop_codon:yes gene_type:complete